MTVRMMVAVVLMMLKIEELWHSDDCSNVVILVGTRQTARGVRFFAVPDDVVPEQAVRQCTNNASLWRINFSQSTKREETTI